MESFNDVSDDGSVLKYTKLSVNASTPVRTTRHAAGFDLFSAESKTINIQDCSVVGTDIAIMLPEGTYGRIAPRSGLASIHFLDVGAGVIDYGYRGNIKVVLFNHNSTTPFHVNIGDRIAQLIVEKICTPRLMEVDIVKEAPRGVRGFGSTGK